MVQITTQPHTTAPAKDTASVRSNTTVPAAADQDQLLLMKSYSLRLDTLLAKIRKLSNQLTAAESLLGTGTVLYIHTAAESLLGTGTVLNSC